MVAASFWLEGEPPADAKPVESKKAKQAKKSYRLSPLRSKRAAEEYYEGRVRFNVLTQQIEIRKRRDRDQWVEHDVEAIAGLYLELSEHLNESADKTTVIDTVRKMGRDNQFNPLVDYFTNLKDAEADHWKFENLATWVFGDKLKSPHANEILKLFLVAAVARTFEPGCYYRFMPILMGEREVGKSFMAHLAPFDLGNTTEPQGNKYAIDQVLVAAKQSLMLEISEADVFTKTVDSSIIKTFVSAGRSVTPIKNKNAQPFVRTWVVFGTSNVSNFIPGDLRRRFLPINLFHLKQGEFHLGDGEKLLDARDGIWAAAVQEYFANWVGKPIKYREELLNDIDEYTSEFISESRWYEDCCELLNFENRIFLSRNDVRLAIQGGSEFAPTDDQINGFMQKHNWSMKHVRLTKGGSQQRLFVHPRHNQYDNYRAAYEAEAEHRPGFNTQIDAVEDF